MNTTTTSQKKASLFSIVKQDRKFVLKYSGLFVTAACLLTVIGGINFVGHQIQQKHMRNASVLNALGEEKSLSQQISKNILLLQREWRDGKRINTSELSELVAGRARFEAILNGLNGKQTTAGAPALGAQYKAELDKLSKAFAPMGAQIDILGQAAKSMGKTSEQSERAAWIAGRKAFSLLSSAGRLDDVPNSESLSNTAFKARQSAASEAAASVSEQVTKTANAFNNYAGDLLATTDTLNARINAEISSTEEADTQLQDRIGYLGFAIFALMIFYFIRSDILKGYFINKSDKESKAILSNIDEGLFLMDANFDVQGQLSKHTKNILGKDFGVGSNFLSRIREVTTPDIQGKTARFLKLLVKRQDIQQSQLPGLNPLQLVEINQGDRAMHVSFSFAKILNASGGLDSFIVSISDSTAKTKLQEELSNERAQNRDQFKLLSELTTSPDRKAILSLVIEIMDWVEKSNALIKTNNSSSQNMFAFVRNLRDQAHTYKGTATNYGLSPVIHFLHDLESVAYAAMKDGKLHTDELLKLPYRFDEIINTLAVYRSIMEPHQASGSLGDTPQTVFALIERTAQDQARRSKKEIRFTASGREPEACLGAEQLSVLRDSLIHLSKNAIIHGIESRAERLSAGKPEVGTVSISCMQENETFICSIFDTGRGIDVEAVRRKLGSIPEWADRAGAMSAPQLADAIFLDGLSTRDEVDTDSGRGIGLSAVKRMVEAAGGAVKVVNKPGLACSFEIKLPAKEG